MNIEILIPEIVRASIVNGNNLTDLLNEYAKIGCQYLNAKGVSIFLLEDRNKAFGNLRIRAGAGEIGKNLLKSKCLYYVPKRPPFTAPIKIDKSIKLNQLSWSEEINIIEAGKLPMGITAYVVRSSQFVHLTTVKGFEDVAKVYEHPEHRGKFENAQGCTCETIMMNPLHEKDNSMSIGVIKAENKESGGVGFLPDDEKFFNLLSLAVEEAITSFERVDSYKNLFGSFYPKWFNENIADRMIEGKKNKIIAKELKDFFQEIEFWDIYGTENIYDIALKTSNEIGRILGLPIKINEIIENLYSVYEPILRTDVRYREHFIHQFHVFALGYSIINTNEFIRGQLLKSLRINNDFDMLITCWFLTAILHDVAYVIQEIKKWLGTFFRKAFDGNAQADINFFISWSDLFNTSNYEYHKVNLIKILIDRFHLNSSNAPNIFKIMNREIFEEQNHGIYSALIMMNLLFENKIIEYDLIKEVALAIATHTPKISGLISDQKKCLIPLSESPISFLLMFCDMAQEWGRPAGLWTKNIAQNKYVELSEISTRENIYITIEYSKATRDVRKYVSSIKKNWCIDPENKIQLKILFKDKKTKGQIYDLSF